MCNFLYYIQVDNEESLILILIINTSHIYIYIPHKNKDIYTCGKFSLFRLLSAKPSGAGNVNNSSG